MGLQLRRVPDSLPQLQLAAIGDGQWERYLDIIACAGPGARLESVSVQAGRGARVDEWARLEIA